MHMESERRYKMDNKVTHVSTETTLFLLNALVLFCSPLTFQGEVIKEEQQIDACS